MVLQVFSKMAESRSLADRWRAHGIALLATRYPSVRVAYLEADGEPLTLFKAADFAYRVVHQVGCALAAQGCLAEYYRYACLHASAPAAGSLPVPVLCMRDGSYVHHGTFILSSILAATDCRIPSTQASVLVRAVPINKVVEAVRNEQAEHEDHAASGAATGTDAASPSGMYVAPGSPLAAALAAGAGAWLGMGGPVGPGAGGEVGTVFLTSGEQPDGGADEEWDGASTMLRQWRRRHLLVNLQAAELEVLYRWGVGTRKTRGNRVRCQGSTETLVPARKERVG